MSYTETSQILCPLWVDTQRHYSANQVYLKYIHGMFGPCSKWQLAKNFVTVALFVLISIWNHFRVRASQTITRCWFPFSTNLCYTGGHVEILKIPLLWAKSHPRFSLLQPQESQTIDLNASPPAKNSIFPLSTSHFIHLHFFSSSLPEYSVVCDEQRLRLLHLIGFF